MPLTGYSTIIASAKPDRIDISSPVTVYEGFISGPAFIICKTDLSTSVISRTYAYGAWDDRSTLAYQ
jgi:hypothetical protein